MAEFAAATSLPPISQRAKRFGLTAQQQASYRADGFLAIGKVIGDTQLAALGRAFDDEFERAARGETALRNIAIADTSDLDAKLTAPRQVLQISPMAERNVAFYHLLFHPHILDMVEDLIGPAIQLYRDQALFKPPRRGGEVYWHQDNAYWQCNPPELVTCWVALDDARLDNGAMQCIPGSHRNEVRHGPSAAATSLYDLSPVVDAAHATVCELPAGGVMFHHCQVVHRTGPNQTARPRRAYAMHFMAIGTRSQRPGEHLRPTFGRPVLRLPDDFLARTP